MPTKRQFLADIQSDNPDVRFAAWRGAREADVDVITDLGRLAVSSNPGVGKAAREALTTLTHAKGAAVVPELLKLTGAEYALPARVLALRLLSLVAGHDAVPGIARSIGNREVFEEVVFCLERIPGGASIKALISAYRETPDDLKPRLLAALGHRRAAEALPLVTEAMRSPNKDVAMAAMKAYGRIGKKPPVAPRFPDVVGLSEWQKLDHMDSLLRWADAQVAEGNHPDTMRIYQQALARPEEHWQCAGIIGIAKMGTAEAATVIFPKLKSDNRNVRLTARNAWQSLATPR